MTTIKEFSSVEEFLLNTPLYSERVGVKLNPALRRLVTDGTKLDGHCIDCQENTTYTLTTNMEHPMSWWGKWDGSFEHLVVRLTCARSEKHRVKFIIAAEKFVLQKIGQFPSLADIANDESKVYRSVLDKQDARELHSAIGLASHGVGIGSFVYLRRVFEHLLRRRFAEQKESNGWSDDDFHSKRMEDKIELLKNHLPSFLVKNRRIYSILSVGIHELDEEACLGFFPVLRESIIVILEEDQQAKQKANKQAELEKAIGAYQPPKA